MSLFISLLALLTFYPVNTNTEQSRSYHDMWGYELKKWVSDKGVVNYKEWKNNQELLNNYIQLLSEKKPNENWGKNYLLTYWMNAYNALTVQLILENYPLKSIRDLKDPWDNKRIEINGEKYSLNDIEHNILRKLGDPRIHFGINCASKSCPKLLNEAFLAGKVQTQLEQAACDFINSDKNKLSKNSIQLSKIFLWFSKDFGSKEERINFIKIRSNTPISNQPKISYLTYDWSLNE